MRFFLGQCQLGSPYRNDAGKCLKQMQCSICLSQRERKVGGQRKPVDETVDTVGLAVAE